MPVRGTFVDSVDNPGGRDRWVERMVAHHRNLGAVHATVDCWLTRRQPAWSPRPRAAPHHNQEVLRLQRRVEAIHDSGRQARRMQRNLTEQRELCARAAHVACNLHPAPQSFGQALKRSTSSALRPTRRVHPLLPPTSLSPLPANPANARRADRLSRNRRAREAHAHAGTRTAHHLNLAHMNRRMDEYTSLTERRKNPYDTTVHPARLFRRRSELPPDQLLEQHLAIAATRAAVRRPASAGDANLRLSAAAVHMRAEAAADAQLRAERGATAQPTLWRRPQTRARSPRRSSEYDEYAEHLTSRIVADRLYRADDLRRYLHQAMKDPHWAHLDENRLLRRTEDIAAEFYCDL